MTLTEVATLLQNPNLLADLRFPAHKDAVKWGAEYVLDLKDLLLAVDLYLESPDNLRRQLLTTCVENAKARAAA